MKKKGLIISTVVMVVVLIASLTTATYAWFTAADAVKVDSINLNVKSSAKVQVGVRVNDSAGYDGFRYNEMTPANNAPDGGWGNDATWAANENIGLGSTLTFNGLELGRDKAVGSSTANTNWGVGDGKTAFDTNTLVLGTQTTPKYIVKAKGAGTEINYSTAALADANRDYLDAIIGVEAYDNDITGTYVKVTVTTTDTNKTLGINASVHFVIVANDKYIDFQPFGDTSKHTTTKASLNHNTTVPTGNIGFCKPTADNQVSSTFYFWVGQGTKSGDGNYGVLQTGGQQISEFRILAYIDGADPHCVKDATGGCKIDIEFDGTKDVKCEKLGDTAQTAVSAVKFIAPSTAVPA